MGNFPRNGRHGFLFPVAFGNNEKNQPNVNKQHFKMCSITEKKTSKASQKKRKRRKGEKERVRTEKW